MEKTESAVHEEPTMCTKKEKIGHAIGVLGHDSAYTLWAMWMTPFLTDIVQLPAAILGGLLAFGRVFDGVNDIMMGSIADRTRSKFGRFRPWLLWSLYCGLPCTVFRWLGQSDSDLYLQHHRLFCRRRLQRGSYGHDV